MKFGRLLRTTAEDLPEMQSLFLSYKQLKKQLKRLPVKEQLEQQEAGAVQALTEEENKFVIALVETLSQMNQRFLDKEENCIIRVEMLETHLASATTPEQLGELHQQFVDFHGEVLLLLHWSILAYTATVKILKKHHKRTGLLVRAPQLGDLLSQPFCSTELMTSIAHRVEEDIAGLAGRGGFTTPAEAAAPVLPGGAAADGEGGALATSCQSNMLAGLDLALLRRLANDPAASGSSGDLDTSELAGGEVSSVTTKRKAQGEGACAPASTPAEPSSSKRACLAAGPAGTSRQQQQPPAELAQQQLQQQPAVLGGAQPMDDTEAAGRQHKVQASPTTGGAAPAAATQAVCPSAVAAASSGDGPAGGSSSSGSDLWLQAARHGSILRQTQVALTTWAHLHSSASTPSTVLPGPLGARHGANPAATTITESSAA